MEGNKKSSGISLAKGKEHLRHRRFTLPKWSKVREFVMRELDGGDDLDIATLAQASLTLAQHQDGLAVYEARQKQAKKTAFVSVDGRAVNSGGDPFDELDGWPSRALRLVDDAFNELNGVSDEELKAFRTGAEDVEPEAMMMSTPTVTVPETET